MNSPAFGSSEIIPISPEDVPADVALEFWCNSGGGTKDSRLIMPEFNGLYLVRHGDETTYLAHHIKKNLDSEIESDIYLADVDATDKMIGIGEVRYLAKSSDAFYASKPFVGWTKTFPDKRNDGRGRRRILTMAAASKLLNEFPLHSSTNFRHKAAQSIWETLVSEGCAKRYIEHAVAKQGGLTRYMFL